MILELSIGFWVSTRTLAPGHGFVGRDCYGGTTVTCGHDNTAAGDRVKHVTTEHLYDTPSTDKTLLTRHSRGDHGTTGVWGLGQLPEPSIA